MRGFLAMTVTGVFVVGACGGSPPPAQPAPMNRAEVMPRATPAPAIAWREQSFAIDGLPAVARGGELAIVAASDGDGGRGYPNLRVEVRDRSDKVVQTIGIMVANDYERLAPGGAPSPELARRIADANHELAMLHGLHDLVVMHPLERQKPADEGDPHLAIGDGFDVDWNLDHLHVFRHDANRSFITLDGKPWLAKPGPRCASCDPCENPAFLANAYHARDERLIVVELGYHGTDMCWEPGHQWHVVAW